MTFTIRGDARSIKRVWPNRNQAAVATFPSATALADDEDLKLASIVRFAPGMDESARAQSWLVVKEAVSAVPETVVEALVAVDFILVMTPGLDLDAVSVAAFERLLCEASDDLTHALGYMSPNAGAALAPSHRETLAHELGHALDYAVGILKVTAGVTDSNTSEVMAPENASDSERAKALFAKAQVYPGEFLQRQWPECPPEQLRAEWFAEGFMAWSRSNDATFVNFPQQNFAQWEPEFCEWLSGVLERGIPKLLEASESRYGRDLNRFEAASAVTR